MRINLVIVSLLCFISWMNLVHATHGRLKSCCPGVSTTKAPLNRIVNYTKQSVPVCPVEAVVFLTICGNRICSDPNSNWTKRAISKVDSEKQALKMKGSNEEGSTSDTTPAVSSTSKNAPQTRPRRGRKGKGKCP